MKPRTRHPPRKHTVRRPDSATLPEAASRPVDWSEPAEAKDPRANDIERDRVPPEVGPDDVGVDPRLEH
jgi:hypothetical protein